MVVTPIRVLVVYRANRPDFDFDLHQAFISDQIKSIKSISQQVSFTHFPIKGKGFWGYLKSLFLLYKKLKEENYDVLHAHFSLSGLVASLQSKIPVVVTMHGSDINNKSLRPLTIITSLLCSKIIAVSTHLRDKNLSIFNYKTAVIPCGVDIELFRPKTKLAQHDTGMNAQKKTILFSSSFDNPIKNFELLKNAILLVQKYEIEVLELKNKTREQVAELINRSDLCVLTSFSEGSPQFIKEAMACNRPIIATDVGDIKHLFDGTSGCFLTDFTPENLADQIEKVLTHVNKSDGRSRIIRLRLDSNAIANQIVQLYTSINSKGQRW